MAPLSAWRMVLSPCPPAAVIIFSIIQDRRNWKKTCRGRGGNRKNPTDKSQYKSNELESALWPSLSNNPERSLFAVPWELSLPAGSSGFGNTGCHSSFSAEMSPSSPHRGEAWGQTPRPTDRQTTASPALWSWNSSHFSQEVVAHWDASLLRHNKVGLLQTQTHRERKVWGQPGARRRLRVEIECVDCLCKLWGESYPKM